jgi:superfamily II DNA or RNA helicase
VPMDVSDVKVENTKDGIEYKQSDVFKKFNKPVMYAGCVENYIKFASGKKAVCFNANVAHSKRQTEEFIKAGIPAAHLDGKTKKSLRRQIFKDFKSGKIMVLCNCGVATTGWDEPTIECVIVNRLTMSLALYLQMIGRGGRPCPEIGKTGFIIIDQGSNYLKHGYWDSDRYYSLDISKMSATAGVAPMIQCEKCEAFIPASKVECPFCKQQQERKEPSHADSKLEQAEFAILDTKKGHKHFKPIAQMTVAELEEFRVHKNYSMGWISRQLQLRGEASLIQYASLKGYARAWADRQLKQVQERKDNATGGVWEFIKLNGHLTPEELKQFSIKKLKDCFSNEEINEMIPDILQAAEDFRNGKIDVEGNLIVK